jgi:hypothetical protein
MTAWTEDTTEATIVATIRETATRAKTDTGTRTETPHVVIQGTTEILVKLRAAIPETPETLETHHAAILEMPHDASTMTLHHDTETTPHLYDTETTRRLIRVDGDRNHGQETYKVASVLQLTFTFSYTIHIAFQFTDYSYGCACLSDSDRFRLSDALTPQITFQYSDVNNASVQHFSSLNASGRNLFSDKPSLRRSSHPFRCTSYHISLSSHLRLHFFSTATNFFYSVVISASTSHPISLYRYDCFLFTISTLHISTPYFSGTCRMR